MTEIMKGAEPFMLDGDDRGILLLHGFTGTTQSMRPVGEGLHDRFGFTVCGPRLKGHGTSPDDMETTSYLDWLASAEEGLQTLLATKRQVFVAGLSMGGTLTLNLAARFPDRIAGIAPVNGAVGVFDGGMAELVCAADAPARIPGIGSDIKAPGVEELAYKEVPVACLRQIFVLMCATRDLLPRIVAPALVFQSREDHVVPEANAEAIMASIGSTDARLLRLTDSYHVATLDNDRDLIVERMGAFFSSLG